MATNLPNLPPLPKIEGDIDLVLDVYTHKSLRLDPPVLNDDYGDTDRLAELGAKILELAITFHYYSKKPMLTATEVAEKSTNALSDENLGYWLDTYGLRNKLRFAPSEKNTIGNPQEVRRFFNTYVGALHVRNGMSTIQEWISRLIDPDADPTPYFPGLDMHRRHQSWSPSPAQPPNSPPPPLPPGISAPKHNGGVPLSLFNQTAVQKGYTVTYPAEQVGPPHLPTWTVKCCINGVEKGRGARKSQKLAKEEAARQAWGSLGW